jgi:hypothetical protein
MRGGQGGFGALIDGQFWAVTVLVVASLVSGPPARETVTLAFMPMIWSLFAPLMDRSPLFAILPLGVIWLAAYG